MSYLRDKKCKPCEEGGEPLKKDQIDELLSELSGWQLSKDEKTISREFVFLDFVQAVGFVDKVADLAEWDGHHPDIHIKYNKVLLELSTHAIDGLSENDFILASKIDSLD